MLSNLSADCYQASVACRLEKLLWWIVSTAVYENSVSMVVSETRRGLALDTEWHNYLFRKRSRG